MFDQLIKKINDRAAKIGVVGLGYVGLPLFNMVLQRGFNAHGFDIDSTKLQSLEAGVSYLEHISVDIIAESLKSGKCALSTTFDAVSECDLIILCVPTPLNSNREPDLSYVLSSLDNMRPFLRAGQALSLESTTYPGTTEELILPVLLNEGFSVGEDYFLLYSPEREDPGNERYDFSQIPKVVSGISPSCIAMAECFYGTIVGRTVSVSSTKCAEMTKILENTYRSVNIALVNELKMVADAMGIDIFEVISAAATKPFGYQPFYPGPGLGGHCIPIDPFYLTWKAREYGLHTKFIELAGEVNTSMPNYVVNKISLGLNQYSKAIKGSKILILGVAYKKNIGDVRESPGIEIIDKLQKLGANVSYYDPHVSETPKMRRHKLALKSIKFTAEVVSKFDACVLVTDHDDVDYDCLKRAALIIDTRGKLDCALNPNLISA